jgi:hypothetical protein
MTRFSAFMPVALLACLAAVGGGCATTVRPEARPIDPVAVFLTNYGVHSSLMLPTPDGRFVEYSFGDYGYAALNRGGPHNALGALFVSGQSGIGRRFLSVRPGEDAPRPAHAPRSVQRFYANRFQVYALVRELDQRYRKGADKPVHNPVTDTVFVKDTEHYSIANNCNHMTGRMLRQLGCEVRGPTATPAYKIVGKQTLPPVVDLSYASKPGAASRSAPEPARRAAAAPSYTRVEME